MRFLSLFIFLFVLNALSAQVHKETFKPKLFEDIFPYYSFSYWGEAFFHPGFKIGYDMPYYSKGKIITNPKRKKTKYRLHQIYANANMAYFVHPGNHQGLQFGYDLGYRVIKKRTKNTDWDRNGFVFEAFINADYFIQINSGTTYRQNAKGELVRAFPMRNYFLTGLGFGLGYSFNKNCMLSLRPNFSFQMPYNTTVMPRFFMEIAVLHTLKK